MTHSQSNPLVSVIMPTYNRARFIGDAFASMRSQQCTDWELIVVDDGSTDESREIIEDEFRTIEQPTRYIHQENGGAYAARNTGLENAKGKYIAFYDSDDQWLPHHLSDCVNAMERNPEVDWVSGALKRVHVTDDDLIEENNFYVDGDPRDFLTLNKRKRGDLCIVEDDRLLECMITGGHFSGLQCSLIRATVFAEEHFQADFRNFEDQLYAIRAAGRGCVFGYFDKVHLKYVIHHDNSSAARDGISVDHQERIELTLLRGYGLLRNQLSLTRRESKALIRKLAGTAFWRIGYSVYWCHGHKQKAFEYFRRGIKLRPFYVPYWKTYCVSRAKHVLGRA